MKKLIASDPVIIEKNKLLVVMDNKDPFYKIPGGTLEKEESLEDCAIRELKEETGFSCELIKKLPTMKLTKNLGASYSTKIELHHYLAKLTNPIKNYNSFNYNGHFVAWINLQCIKDEKCFVASNIRFLIEEGKIK
ncbi:MAG TPA: NUDIX hydrolase [Candidatus Pacearchaeota archaeon]|nr:NUDIX hydrolase [Candidatus Pacearchaeota archaeon]